MLLLYSPNISLQIHRAFSSQKVVIPLTSSPPPSERVIFWAVQCDLKTFVSGFTLYCVTNNVIFLNLCIQPQQCVPSDVTSNKSALYTPREDNCVFGHYSMWFGKCIPRSYPNELSSVQRTVAFFSKTWLPVCQIARHPNPEYKYSLHHHCDNITFYMCLCAAF